MTIRRNQSEDATINLTPMIDVVFLLVIFFMVGSKFSEAESRVNVNVESASQLRSISRTPDQRVVDILPDGQLAYQNQVFAIDDLLSVLKTQHADYPGLKISLRSGEETPYGLTHRVLRTISSAGIDDITAAPPRVGQVATGQAPDEDQPRSQQGYQR